VTRTRCCFASCEHTATAITDGWPFCDDHHQLHLDLRHDGDLPTGPLRPMVRTKQRDPRPNSSLTRAELLAALLEERRRPTPPRGGFTPRQVAS
jgi:hypothetical protein